MGALWEAFKQLIFWALLQIEAVVGDWGLAIIVLTVFFRLLLVPITVKQTKSMYEMQRIQPKIKEIQRKYADDKEKQQEETMKYYQENKVNPLAGCLPSLLPMPLFLALYSVLGMPRVKDGVVKGGILLRYLAKEHETGHFLSLIPDISKSPSAVWAHPAIVGMDNQILAVLPYAILVILFGLSIWLPQMLMPGEKQQKMVGLYMGAFMLFIGWSSPAGVLLYWDVSSIWGVAQQQLITRRLKREHPVEEIVQEPEKPTGQPKAPKPSGGKKKNKKRK